MDNSHLDRKYFIDSNVYNCPFCNRRNVSYSKEYSFSFDWSGKKKCRGYLIKCSSCNGTSMHLSYSDLTDQYSRFGGGIKDIDSLIFYSVPTSYFVIDDRVPPIIRELITEAEGSLKMNFLTGASACMRKAIYELIVIEKCEGKNYEEKIKILKSKYPNVDATLFDILAHIQDMTSDKIHEQSWDQWDSRYLRLIIETLKTTLHEIYVIPKMRAESSLAIVKLRDEILKRKVDQEMGKLV